MIEIWKPVEGYEEKYEVSNLGNVRSLNYNRSGTVKQLSPKRHNNGYLTVTLADNGSYKNKSIHVLVAKAFLANESNLPCVNHIDGDKTHNSVDNLEWISYKGNTHHAIVTGLRSDTNMRGVKGANNKNSKPVLQYTKDGTFVRRWESISDAARFYSKNPCTIVNVMQGRLKTCAGYSWKAPSSSET